MIFFSVVSFVFGACIGSFLNVCIYRMPRDVSIKKPKRSYCPDCEHTLAWYDNIPLLAYIYLGAKCRYCRKKISWRYFTVELITAGCSLFYFCYFAVAREAYVLYSIYFFLTCLLIVATFIDFEFQIIPDEINLWGLVVGVAVSVIYPGLHDEPLGLVSQVHVDGLLTSLWGVLVGGGILYAVAVLGEWLFKKEAMGGGDIKLLGMLGAYLGWQKVIITFFLAPLAGIFFAVFIKLTKKNNVIPYGPFLSLAAIITIFAYDHIIDLLFAY